MKLRTHANRDKIILQLREEGSSTVEIAEKLNIGRRQVNYRLRALKNEISKENQPLALRIRPKQLKQAYKINELIDALLSGKTIKESITKTKMKSANAYNLLDTIKGTKLWDRIKEAQAKATLIGERRFGNTLPLVESAFNKNHVLDLLLQSRTGVEITKILGISNKSIWRKTKYFLETLKGTKLGERLVQALAETPKRAQALKWFARKKVFGKEQIQSTRRKLLIQNVLNHETLEKILSSYNDVLQYFKRDIKGILKLDIPPYLRERLLALQKEIQNEKEANENKANSKRAKRGVLLETIAELEGFELERKTVDEIHGELRQFLHNIPVQRFEYFFREALQAFRFFSWADGKERRLKTEIGKFYEDKIPGFKEFSIERQESIRRQFQQAKEELDRFRTQADAIASDTKIPKIGAYKNAKKELENKGIGSSIIAEGYIFVKTKNFVLFLPEKL